MSDSIFPSLPGLMWDQVTSPQFNTIIKKSVNLQEYRSRGAAYPLWTFKLNYAVLRDTNWSNSTELQELLGFYLAMQGAFDSFLFLNPNDNAVVAQRFGTGDGAQGTFQLCRTYGSLFTLTEPVDNPLSIDAIIVQGVTQNAANYSVSGGNITFYNAPVPAGNISWSGSYYYRCRFTDDTVDFNNMMRGLWELQNLGMVGSPKNKV